MSPSPELARMIQQLAAMPAGDRDYVVGLLGSDVERRLLQLLGKTGSGAISPGLKVALAQVSKGEIPAGMTLRGSETLIRSARHIEASSIQDNANAPARVNLSLIDRMLLRLGLKG